MMPRHSHTVGGAECSICKIQKEVDGMTTYKPKDETREKVWTEAFLASVKAGAAQMAVHVADAALKEFDARFRAVTSRESDDAE